MITKLSYSFLLFFVFCGVIPAQGDQEVEYLTYQSHQTTFYADQEYTLAWERGPHFWQEADALKVRMVYANKTVFDHNYQVKFPLKVRINYPQLRPGVITDPVLIITAFSKGQPLKGIYQKPLFFFHQNQKFSPLLSSIKIGILDQTGGDLLSTLLNQMEVSFTELNDFSDFTGDWIICSGLDFTESFSFFDEMLQAWSKGVSFLILPPMEGEFPWPRLATKESRTTFSHENIIQIFDKRLNVHTVGQVGSQADVYFHLGTRGEEVIVKCLEAEKGYSWLEFRAKGAKIIFLGWDLNKNVTTNPTMLLLLNHILTKN